MKTFSRLKNKNFFLWLFAINILLALTAVLLFQDGMFMDAMLYSSVGHNLANGYGTLWNMHFAKFTMGIFSEQLPLTFWIQAVFFKIFGSSMYVERFYTLIVLLIVVFLINKAWKIFFKKDSNLGNFGWFVVIIWIVIPTSFWAFQNNMLENTTLLFVLISTIFTIKYLQNKGIVYIIFSGIVVFMASFSKGPVGLFVISVPLWYFIFVNNKIAKKFIISSFILVAIPLVIYFTLLQFDTSRISLERYFFARLITRINENPTVDNHLKIFWILFQDLLLPIAILILVVIYSKIKNFSFNINNKTLKYSFFFFFIGLSGVAPLALTKVQKSFYYLPTLPFFAMAFGILIITILSKTFENINYNSIKYQMFKIFNIAVFVFIIVATIYMSGNFKREKDVLNDVYIIKNTVSKYSTISIPNEMHNDWSLHCYLMRYCFINLQSSSNQNEYFLIDKELKSKIPVPEYYRKLNIKTLKYNIYKKRENL